MTKNETIHIRVNEEVKQKAQSTLDMLGISMSEAVNMFLCQVSLRGGLPFSVMLPAPESVIVHSEEELIERLEQAEKQFAEGKVIDGDEFFKEMEKKYGI